MNPLYPSIEPYDHGMLDAGNGHQVYWEACGNPRGKPALVLHGGPGSGCTPWHRRLFDPAAYRIILFDQRSCGRSTPHAGAPIIDLAANTTPHLLADIERLRQLLAIDRWLLLGGSWGSTLALAYAQANPGRVSEMVLFGVTSGRRVESDWQFRGGLARAFPAQWERLRAALPASDRDHDIVEAYAKLLMDPDPAVHNHAAYEWCLWESATPAWPPAADLAPRFQDPAYALAFARIVTHYIRHDTWIEDGALLRDIGLLSNIPAVMINGRHDTRSLLSANDLQQLWPGSEHVIVEEAAHSADNPGIAQELVRATDRFAR